MARSRTARTGVRGALYRGRSTDERKRERRERLLRAALQIFGTRGYAQASIANLCRTAGVTTRHFYEEFPSREALLVALYDDSIQRTIGALRSAVVGVHGEVAERARVGVEALVSTALTDPRRVRIMTVEVVGASPEVERHRLEVERGFVRQLTGEVSRLALGGRLPQRDYTLAAVAMVGAVTALLTHWAALPEPPPMAGLLDEVGRLVIGMLTTPTPGDGSNSSPT
jgi:AcrR family transcriptional regulator